MSWIRIAILADEEKEPGVYELEFSAVSHSGSVRNLPTGRQGLANGIYIYQLITSDFVATKKNDHVAIEYFPDIN